MTAIMSYPIMMLTLFPLRQFRDQATYYVCKKYLCVFFMKFECNSKYQRVMEVSKLYWYFYYIQSF